MTKIELLSPAGDFRSLTAAVKAGADAVYLGLKEFNMRDSAKNFALSDLPAIRKILGKKKLYVTLNTIIYDSELARLEKLVKKLKDKVDAIICWDLSVINLAKKYKIPFFISTQASISNKASALFYKKLGASRAILARELSLKQVREISKIMPVEIFIHGALCVSESGRCFTSQFLHCKSANRGLCRHPCRKSYTVKDDEGNELKVSNNKIFSAKDLCTLPFFEKIKKSGAISFKIEGRNREPEYVYEVTRIYRKALDKKLNKEEIEESMKELEKVYNREFSSGFYLRPATNDDFTSSDSGSQTQKKEFIGSIKHYWPKIGVASLKVSGKELKIGDKILVIGKNTFVQDTVVSLQINHKKVDKAIQGQEVAIKLPPVREKDELYVVVSKK